MANELQRLLGGSGLTLQERACIKLALSLLRAEPAPVWSEEEYLELPRKFELANGKLLVTY